MKLCVRFIVVMAFLVYPMLVMADTGSVLKASKIKDLDQRIKALSQIISQKPAIKPSDLSLAYSARAKALGQKNEPAKAIADYSKALELPSSNYYGRLMDFIDRSYLYEQTGQYSKAARDLRSVIRLSRVPGEILQAQRDVAKLNAKAQAKWAKEGASSVPAKVTTGLEVRESNIVRRGCKKIIIKKGKQFCVKNNQLIPLRCPKGAWTDPAMPGCWFCGSVYPVKKKNGKMTCLDCTQGKAFDLAKKHPDYHWEPRTDANDSAKGVCVGCPKGYAAWEKTPGQWVCAKE